MLNDPGVPYRDSLAKYAAACFNISFSTRNSANSLRSRRYSSADETTCPLGGKSPDWRKAATQLRTDHEVVPSLRAASEFEYPPSTTNLAACRRNSRLYRFAVPFDLLAI